MQELHDIRAIEEDVLALYELIDADGALLGDESLMKEHRELVSCFSKKVTDLELKSLLSGPYDDYNAFLSFYAGAGGTDAQDWAEMLCRMYMRWCEKKGFECDILEYTPGDEAGIKSATLRISGDYIFGFLKHEQGIHRLVRQSPYNANNKRQTSFAAVEVFPQVDTDVGQVELDTKDLKIDTYRASGAGGQHVNKTDSAVRVTHLPTGLVATCQSSRSQSSNKESAMKMLISRLIVLMKEQKKEEVSELKGEQKENAWGHQIRSYVLHPYKLIKDLRTNFETSNVNTVLDGDLDAFINSLLHYKA